VPDTSWDQRFFATTRGKIVLLLRTEPRTVEQLAAALDLTDNAVRAHLVTLERDGLVRQSGSVRTARRPSLSYELAPDADRLFPKAYGTVLSAFLSVLRREVPDEVLARTVREVGRQLASERPPVSADPNLRVQAAVDALQDLGGSVVVETTDEEVHVLGRRCPLAVVVREHPDVCALVEALLEQVTGARVQERCQRSGQPHCHFVLSGGQRIG
jgi:predicted ArsR family transcriptional regulator